VRPFLAAAAARLGGLSGVVRCGSWSDAPRAKSRALLLVRMEAVRPLPLGQPQRARPVVFTAEMSLAGRRCSCATY